MRTSWCGSFWVGRSWRKRVASSDFRDDAVVIAPNLSRRIFRSSAILSIWQSAELQRAQEVQQVLLLRGRQRVVFPDGLHRLRSRAAVGVDGLNQVAGAAIVQEEETLAESPEWSGAEHLRTG